MGGKSSRRKGHGFERAIAKELRESGVFPNCVRQLEYQAGLGVDLQNTGDWDFQLKCMKQYAPITKIEEIPVVEGRNRCLITKGDYKEVMAVIPFDVLIKLLKSVNTKERENVKVTK